MKLSARTTWLTTGAAACAVVVAAGLPKPAEAQTAGGQVTCTGSLPNGWTFAAEALDGRFLHIIWSGTQGQTRVSLLGYYATNADGFPVFRGTLQDALTVAVVDRSGGAPATATEVDVYAEDWGWSQGACRELGRTAPEGVLSTDAILQSLVGTRDSSASNWLRRNGFTRVRVLTHSGTGKIERWQQDPRYPVDVVFSGTIVSDVIPAAP
jgi:hypothetical protein